MLRLIHSPQSRSSRIIWLLEELGAPYEVEYVTIKRADGSGASDPSNPHPDKKVPAIVHDGEVVTESAAIVLYLTDLFPEAGLGPLPGEPGRAAYLSWLAYYAGVAEPVMAFEVAKLGDHPMLRGTFRGLEEMNRRLVETLGKSPYLLGETFSGVDILFASIGQGARMMLPDGEVIDSYLERCQDRPALARALSKDAPG